MNLSTATNAEIDALIDAAIAERKRRHERLATLDLNPEGWDLIEATAANYGCTAADITGPGRSAYLVEARGKIIAALRADGWSLMRIGRLLRRDHTTIIHHLRRAA